MESTPRSRLNARQASSSHDDNHHTNGCSSNAAGGDVAHHHPNGNHRDGDRSELSQPLWRALMHIPLLNILFVPRFLRAHRWKMISSWPFVAKDGPAGHGQVGGYFMLGLLVGPLAFTWLFISELMCHVLDIRATSAEYTMVFEPNSMPSRHNTTVESINMDAELNPLYMDRVFIALSYFLITACVSCAWTSTSTNARRHDDDPLIRQAGDLFLGHFMDEYGLTGNGSVKKNTIFKWIVGCYLVASGIPLVGLIGLPWFEVQAAAFCYRRLTYSIAAWILAGRLTYLVWESFHLYLYRLECTNAFVSYTKNPSLAPLENNLGEEFGQVRSSHATVERWNKVRRYILQHDLYTGQQYSTDVTTTLFLVVLLAIAIPFTCLFVDISKYVDIWSIMPIFVQTKQFRARAFIDIVFITIFQVCMFASAFRMTNLLDRGMRHLVQSIQGGMHDRLCGSAAKYMDDVMQQRAVLTRTCRAVIEADAQHVRAATDKDSAKPTSDSAIQSLLETMKFIAAQECQNQFFNHIQQQINRDVYEHAPRLFGILRFDSYTAYIPLAAGAFAASQSIIRMMWSH